MEEKTIIALEIGSSKIKGATGSIGPDGALNVKAVEEEPILDIVRYGAIRNIYETAQAVRNVIARLELREAPRKVEGVYLSIGGRSLSSQPIEVERRLPSESIITAEIIEDISREALESPLIDRSVVAVTPRQLLIDNEATPRPVGVMGSHIKARLNLISCRTQIMRNLSVVVEEKLGLKVIDTFVHPLAIANLVLLNDEKKLGCMLVDFGAETTTVAIYKNGNLIHLAVLPMGSRNITRDIASLNYLEEQAEEIKKTSGSALPTPGEAGQTSALAPDMVTINNYVAARAGEIMLNICEQVKYAGLTPDKLPDGIIIVGRGARLNRFNQRLEQMSGMKVRAGVPGNRLRILDGRIQVADSVDVLSILAEAAKNDPRECLSPAVAAPVVAPSVAAQGTPAPAVQQQPAQPVYGGGQPAQQPAAAPAASGVPPRPVPVGPTFHRETDEAGSNASQPEPRRAKQPGGFARFYNGLVSRVAKAMQDSFDEEEDEE